jgi:hypothetical protein
MSKQSARALVLVLTVFAPGIAAAQHEGHGAPAPAQPQDPAACAAAARQTLPLLDTLDRRVEAARQTNSPSELRAALAEAQSMLMSMRVRLAPCAATAQPASAVPGPPAAPSPVQPAAPGTSGQARAAGATDHAGMGHAMPQHRQKFLADPAEYAGHDHEDRAYW